MGASGVDATGRVIGVKAVGGTVGVQAISNYGPAGLFYRELEMAVPQVCVTSTPMAVPDPVDLEEDIQVIPTNEVDQLPQNAYAGELLMTIQASKDGKGPGPGAEATLWLCVVTGSSEKEPAIWKQFLLGPPIEGKINNPSWGLG